MTGRFSRAQLVSRGAKGGVAALAAGSALGAFAQVAQAATLPDNDLAYLRLLIATELLGADFYKNAAEAEPYTGPAKKYLDVALANETAHYTALSAILTDAGQIPATADDIDFSYPKGSFTSTGAVTKLAVTFETLFLGAYLGAVGGIQTASLAQPIAQIAASQAQHLSVFSQLLGRSGFKGAMPAPLSMDAVTAALGTYTS